ncbi:MAG: hypothetical protein COW71_05895 [Ignavibacteriales bacterium CG18_big_fil_WC_8_21_14_2_50_31_20]|nr:MAG: hypothetical protein COW71_05895 [Ignavibacteriales bacterium CG18_big_fil_WC_8_21_14_2_50_31_20]
MNEKLEYYNGSFCTIKPNHLKERFGSATGKNIKVAVVDSGWDYSQNDLRIMQGVGLISDKNGFELIFSNDYNDRIGHGTAVTDLILQLAPDVSILPIRVFGSRLETSPDILVKAISWSIKKEVNIINLSLGTLLSEAIEPLYKICEIARRKNIIIVASKSNSDDWSYPAIFENSIGVASGDFENQFDYKYFNEEAIECIAKGYNQYVLWQGNKREYLSGNSFAAPNITGIISLILEKYPNISLENIRTFLLEYSI